MDPTQLEEFKELGYTVLKSVHGDESMAGWRATQDYLQTTTLRPNVRRRGRAGSAALLLLALPGPAPSSVAALLCAELDGIPVDCRASW
jgi:hypothetical protein